MNNGWIRLCALLDDDVELLAAVRLAAESTDDRDPWLVMIDGLDDAGALAYLEPTDTGVQLADALPGLPRIAGTGADLDPVGDVDIDLPSAIVVANGILAAHGLTLVYLEEDPDAYPLVAVALEDVEQIVALAGMLGHTARPHP